MRRKALVIVVGLMLIGSAAFVWLAVDGSAGDPPVGTGRDDPGHRPTASDEPFQRLSSRQ